MKALRIWYFSGTGNSLAAARKIAEGYKAHVPGANVSIESMAAALARDAAPPDADTLVGFVFPMYFYGCPGLVLDFARSRSWASAGARFAVVTFGGPLTGSLVQLDRALRRGSAVLDAGWYLTMPNNYPLGSLDLDPPDKSAAILAAAGDKLDRIVGALVAGTGANGERFGRRKAIERGWADHLQAPVSAAFLAGVGKNASRFSVTDACSGCGLCAAICPSKTIVMEGKHPVWKTFPGRRSAETPGCQLCLACYNACPKHAVAHAKIASAKGQYFHPAIKPSELGLAGRDSENRDRP